MPQWRHPQAPAGSPRSLPAQGRQKEVGRKLRAVAAGHPSHGPRLPGCLQSPLEGSGQGSLGNVFPEVQAEVRVLKDYSGKELSTPRQVSELDKGQGCTHSPPSCLSLLLLPPGAVLIGKDGGSLGSGPGWIGEPGRRTACTGTGETS